MGVGATVGTLFFERKETTEAGKIAQEWFYDRFPGEYVTRGWHRHRWELTKSYREMMLADLVLSGHQNNPHHEAVSAHFLQLSMNSSLGRFLNAPMITHGWNEDPSMGKMTVLSMMCSLTGSMASAMLRLSPEFGLDVNACSESILSSLQCALDTKSQLRSKFVLEQLLLRSSDRVINGQNYFNLPLALAAHRSIVRRESLTESTLGLCLKHVALDGSRVVLNHDIVGYVTGLIILLVKKESTAHSEYAEHYKSVGNESIKLLNETLKNVLEFQSEFKKHLQTTIRDLVPVDGVFSIVGEYTIREHLSILPRDLAAVKQYIAEDLAFYHAMFPPRP